MSILLQCILVCTCFQGDGIDREACAGAGVAAAVMPQTQPAPLRERRGSASRQDRLRYPQLCLSRKYI